MTTIAEAGADGVARGGANSPLWTWTLGAYARPGVPDACLHLQDAHGQNVPLLLWAGWTATTGRALDPETIEAACDAARAWDAAAVAPLRAVRRTLKAPVPDLADAGRLALRDQVKAVELAAERALMADLEPLAPVAAGPARPTMDALVEVARVWSRIVPRPALAALAERLPA